MVRGPSFVALALACGLPLQAAEDWNFTPTNYQDLINSGKDLDFDGDSDWFPRELKDNLKATLKKVLDPKTQPTNTEGINEKDFYHGHVVCPKPCSDEQKKAREGFGKAEEDLKKNAMGTTVPKINEETLPKWRETMKAVQQAAAATLKVCLGKGCGVVYHTFEEISPAGSKPGEFKVGDPRRNLFTPNGPGGMPKGFTPPDMDRAGTYDERYCDILQFAFLIDKQGHIHVTTGSHYELSGITGNPPK